MPHYGYPLCQFGAEPAWVISCFSSFIEAPILLMGLLTLRSAIVSTVMVTGGGGFLGSHLAEHYLKLGYKVICVHNFCTGMRGNRAYLESISRPDSLLFLEEDVRYRVSVHCGEGG